MNRLKVCTIFGTRPEAIKLAPVIKRLDLQPGVEHRVLVTGQHRELLDQVLELFSIRPSRDLRVMHADQQLSALTARVLVEVEEDLQAFHSDWVVVQGDTTTALAASLAGYYLRIPVAHVEAGLRTNDRYNPFPEEVNRRLIDHLAHLHFAATEQARVNLLREGLDPCTIYVTGNTGIDALLDIASRDGESPLSFPTAEHRQHLVLVTAHRRESFGQELRNICRALRALVARNPNVHVIYAVHPNPNVSLPVRRELQGLPRIELLAAVDYLRFVQLMKRSFLILTDSGGIQEEAPSLGKPVLVLRTRTERVEAIEAGTAKLVGTDPDRIVEETEQLLHDPIAYARMAQARNPYGDGHAAERIVEILMRCSTAARIAEAGVGEQTKA